VKTPIMRGDYLFRTVAVPAGEHTVEFVYQPMALTIGAGISLLAAWAIGLVCLLPALAFARDRFPLFRRPRPDELLPRPVRDPTPETSG
jgi:hypothetical protein